MGGAFDFLCKYACVLRAYKSDAVFCEQRGDVIVDLFLLLARFLCGDDDQSMFFSVKRVLLNKVAVNGKSCGLSFSVSGGRKNVWFHEINYAIFIGVRYIHLAIVDWNCDLTRLPDSIRTLKPIENIT